MNPIRSDDIYRGWCGPDEIPYKRSDEVTYLKGARLYSMHPKKRCWYLASRTQTVEVFSITYGSELPLFDVYEATDTRPERVVRAQRFKDIIRAAKRLGYSGQWHDEDAVWDFLKPFCIRKDRDSQPFENRLVLPRENPTVRWGGAGGYWVGVDINDIVGVKALADSETTSS